MSDKSKTYSDQKNWSDTYLTDPVLLKLLGRFDLDPCCPENMPWRTADRMLTKEDDGLSYDWSNSRVFMNPPYRGVMKWAQKFVTSCEGIALLNGRSTETKATQFIMGDARAIWFPKGRLTFYKIDGTPWKQKWFPSLLIGMSKKDTDCLHEAADQFGGMVFYG